MNRHFNILLLLVWVVLFFACTNNDEKQTASDVEAQADSIFLDLENDVYKSWDDYYSADDIHFAIDSFLKDDTIKGELHTRSADIDEDFYRHYGTLIEYNKDSTLFLDPYSYSLIIERQNGKLIARGGEIDHEVSVVNIAQNTRTRLLFCGPSCEIQKVFWHSDHIVAIMGLTSEYADEYYTPVIWFVNINNGLTIPFHYNSNVSIAETHDYLGKHLKEKGVILEY